MRLRILVLALLWPIPAPLAPSAAAGTQPVVLLEGRVVADGTATPLAGARVTVVSEDRLLHWG